MNTACPCCGVKAGDVHFDFCSEVNSSDNRIMSPREFVDQLLEALGLTKDMNICAIDIHVDYGGDLPTVSITKLAGQEEVDILKGIKLGDKVIVIKELAFE